MDMTRLLQIMGTMAVLTFIIIIILLKIATTKKRRKIRKAPPADMPPLQNK